MSPRKKYPLLEKIEIIDIAAEGKAIGKFNNQIIFVPLAIPGDIVDIQITKKKKNYMEGFVSKIHSHSSIRTDAFCEHFGNCGGCKWQMLPYFLQLKYKQKQVIDNLERIGHIQLHNIKPIISSPKDKFYRNKLEYTFSNSKWLTTEEIESGIEIEDRKALGFHISGRFDKVLDINKCYLQDEPSNSIRKAIKSFALKNEYDFFDQRKKEGFLRNLIIRNTTQKEIMVILSFYKDDKERITKLLDFLKKEYPKINSLMYVVNSKVNDTINDLKIKLYHGREFIVEKIGDIKFFIGPKTFFQINIEQTLRMYNIIKEYALLDKEDIVYDLYTGAGSIALYLASDCKKIVGIEYVAEAIEDANKNAIANNIKNVSFVAGDIKNLLNYNFIEKNGNPNVIITDPPRAGMHPEVIQQILNIMPSKLIYVSCNPATQARDLNLLTEKYRITEVQPIDMFPHTHHVENVVKLMLKSTN